MQLTMFAKPIAPPQTLRPYQEEKIAEIFELWKKPNKKKVMLQLPTGTGKTTVFCEIIKRKSLKTLIVVHRLELIDQIAERLSQFGLTYGFINANKMGDSTENIQVATIQTLSRRNKPKADLVIIDEAHHARAESYQSLFDLYPDALFLGVTATPIRLSGEGFDDLFQVLVTSPQIKDFIKEGYLCEAKQFAEYCPDLTGVKVIQGDYNPTQLNPILEDGQYISSTLGSYLKHGQGKKFIIFCNSIAQSIETVLKFQAAGIKTAHLDAETPKFERGRILADFRAGVIQGISNVNIISEGFDVPDAEVVILAAPTKSLGKYLQMVGRVLRPSPNKSHAIILDCGNAYLDLGLAISDRKWTLKPTKEKNRTTEDYVKLDEQGHVIRVQPQELDGTDLIEVDAEMMQLVHFEEYLKKAKEQGSKGTKAWYQYLKFRGDNPPFTWKELNYIRLRLYEINPLEPKQGFWFYAAKSVGLR